MIKHIYLIKLKDRRQASMVAEKLMTLKEHVPELYDLEVGIDFKGADTSYDVAECCTFLNEDDFIRFGTNPYHEHIRQFLKTVQQSIAKVDYTTAE